MAQAPGQALRKEVWNKRVRAKMHSLFFTELLSRRIHLNRFIQIAIAVLSSGAFATVFFLDASWAIEYLAAATALFAIVALGWFPPSDIAKLSKIADHWKQRVNYWDAAWARIQRNETVPDAELDAARADDDRVSDDEVHFSIPERDRVRIQERVRRTVESQKPIAPPAPPKSPGDPHT